MVGIREITLDWNSANSPGGTSVLYFLASGTAVDQRAAIQDWFTACRDLFPASTTMSVATEGREVEDSTGTLTGVWAGGTALTQNGNAGGGPVANAVQGLMRFTTPVVVAGRLLKGRMFVPGLATLAENNGQATDAARLTLGQEWLDNVVPVANQVIWSRPFAGSVGPPARPPRAGSSAPVDGVSVWQEFAVLRQRR